MGRIRLAAILLLCVLTALCSGCNQPADTPIETTAPTAAAASERASVITRTQNAAGRPNDEFIAALDGATISIAYPYAMRERQSEYAAAVEQLYGVKLQQSVIFDRYEATLTASLASRTAEHSIYYAKQDSFGSYIKNGYAADLTDAMKQSGVDLQERWYCRDATEMLNINYKQLGWVSYDQQYTLPSMILYNSALTDHCGLGSIETAVEDGEWTLDRLEKFATSINGQGKIGFANLYAADLLQAIITAKNGSIFNFDKGEQPSCSYGSLAVKSSLRLLEQWYGEGVCSDFSKDGSAFDKLSEGSIAMMFVSRDTAYRIMSHGTEASLSVAPFPNDWQSKRYVSSFSPEYICFIPAQYQSEADKILFLQNELYRQSYAFCATDLATELDGLNTEPAQLERLFNMKLGRGGYSVRLSLSKLLEYDFAVGINSIAGFIAAGGSADDAEQRYFTAAHKACADSWGEYKFTGRVDKIFALE